MHKNIFNPKCGLDGNVRAHQFSVNGRALQVRFQAWGDLLRLTLVERKIIIMKVVIIQPHFLPFTGYFDLMNRADIFVYYDTVQFVRRSWHCRTYITEKGLSRWLSASVKTHNGSRKLLREMSWADDVPWRKKTAKRLENVYANNKEPYLLKQITELVEKGPTNLCDWNIEGCSILASILEIKIKTLRSSELKTVEGDKQKRIINLCQELGATHYICGPGSRNYIQDEDFAKFDIKVEWIEYNYKYKIPTQEGVDVSPSVLDLILKMGTKFARSVLSD